MTRFPLLFLFLAALLLAGCQATRPNAGGRGGAVASPAPTSAAPAVVLTPPEATLRPLVFFPATLPALPSEEARQLAELSRQFQAAAATAPAADSARRRDCLVRLLDYYFFRVDRLTGMTHAGVEAVFGPGTLLSDSPDPALTHWAWDAGPDRLLLGFTDGRVVFVAYILGY